jgi:hypothetical protein
LRKNPVAIPMVVATLGGSLSLHVAIGGYGNYR